MNTIAIVAGGDSSEFEISVKSAGEVGKMLSSNYIVYVIMIRGTNWYWEDQNGRYHNIDKNDFSLVTDEHRVRFDGVFVAIHGTPGENGLLQGYFDMLHIPYTSCGAFCSALTFNKQATKLFLKEYKIQMADAIIIRKGENPPAKSIARQNRLSELKTETRTLIFYEAPHRIQEMIEDLHLTFGEEREVTLCRELTKTFETILKAPLKKLLALSPDNKKGEFVVVVSGISEDEKEKLHQIKAQQFVKKLMADLPLKKSVQLSAEVFHVSKNTLYQWALTHKR